MINVRTLKNLKENDGLTLKKGKRITYKTGWQVATEGIETTDPYVAIKGGIYDGLKPNLVSNSMEAEQKFITEAGREISGLIAPFLQLLKNTMLSEKAKEVGFNPIIFASHSNVYNLCDRDRNLTDDRLLKIKKLDGVVALFSHRNFIYKDSLIPF